MTSTQPPSHSHSRRKPIQTYSLTINGNSFGLPLQHSVPVATIRTPPRPPHHPSLEELHIPNHITYSPTASSSHPYVPHVIVPRGPRARNLYLYRPTEADYATARRRSISKAAAMEDARSEREDDERRRNISLGIPVPRKSTRKVRSSANVAVELEGIAVTTDKSPSVGELRFRKRRRATVNKKPAAQLEPVFGDVSAHIAPPSNSPAPLTVLSETPSSPKKLRRKQQPKSNPRPTRRLTTRGSAKTKAVNIGGRNIQEINVNNGSSNTEDLELMDLDVDNQAEIGSGSTNLSKSPPNASKHDGIDVTDDQVDLAQIELPDRTSLSGDSSLPSSDTLWDVEINSNRSPKEDVSHAVGFTDIRLNKFPLPSRSSTGSTVSIPLIDRSVSPSAGAAPFSALASKNEQTGSNKRKSEEIDVDSKTSTQCRRSSRIPKKRKLQ